MADLAALRRDCREARLAREAAWRVLHNHQSRLAENERQLAAIPPFDLNTPDAQARRDDIQQLQLGIPGDQQQIDAAEATVTAADAAYDAAATAEPALFEAGGDLPLLLLPVRVETVFRPAGPGAELWIRVYPDDIHIDSHERELTERERAAGEAYWRAVWAAGPDEERHAVAWRELLLELGAGRAAWALEALRPAGALPAQPTPPGEPGPDPGPFPDVGSRVGVWTRAAHTKLLPDRFVFSGYRAGRLMWRVEGAAIPDVLPVGFAPPGSDPAPSGQDLPWDAESRWLVDFEAAKTNGMGVTVPLDDPDLHYDLVTVTGVSPGADPLEGARRADELLTAHAYTTGLDVLPAGTPTNNTAESRSGWRSRDDPRPPRDPAPLREPVASAVRALAIDGAEGFATVRDDVPDDNPLIARVHGFVGRLLALSADWSEPGALPLTVDVGYVVDHFTSFVRSRGPLPTLRVGRQPYGLLPVTAHGLWRGDDVDPRIVAAVASVVSYFSENVHRASRVGTGPDQDAVIVDLLSRRATSRRVRRTDEDPVSADATQPPATIGIAPPTSPFALRGPVRPPTSEIAAAVEPTAELLALVAQKPLAALAAVTEQIAALVAGWDPSQPQPDLTFLKPQLDTLKVGLAPLLKTDSAGVMYQLTVPVLAGSVLLTYMAGLGVKQPSNPPAVLLALQRALDGVTRLVADSVALEEQAVTDLPGVEGLLCECLDTTAHRADAWVTSLATARLQRTREEQPAGLRTGAYGWLADVQPLEPGRRTAGDGYIVAPSLHHATTAAVLRSGWLAHSDRRALAVNLTSGRVRRALALLEGAHAGQPLEALLGYRFERGLHDAQLDRLIAPFRARYPLAPLVDPAAAGAAEAQAAIAARNVVDGQALRRDRAAFDGAAPPLAAGDPGLDTVRALLAELDDAVDSVGDLLLAESVHHLVGGNPLRAGLAADAIGRGDGVPPDFEVITTPRSGSTVTYAAGVLAPAPNGASHGWSDDRALAKLEPALERWCRARLGAAGAWRFDRANGAGAVTLEALSALEVVLGAPSALLHRLAGTAGLADTGRFEELSALAGALRAALAAGAPLLASHLDPTTADGWAAADLDELGQRVGAWLATVRVGAVALGTARAALAVDPSSDQATRDLATGLDVLAGAGLPVGAGTPEDADRVLAAVAAASLPTAMAAPPSGQARNPTSTLAWATAVTGMVRALVGDGLLLVPILRLDADPAAAMLAPANRPAGADDDAVADWLREVGRVRPAAAGLTEALLGADVVAGTDPPRFVVAQAPPAASPPWIALAAGAARACCVLAADGDPDPSAVAGFVVDAWSETFPRPGRQPNGAEEVAAIAFHAPRPDARPPQALLLAVPPDRTRGWRMEDVHAVVEETFDLARIRTLDLVDLPELRGPLPPNGPALPSLDDLG